MRKIGVLYSRVWGLAIGTQWVIYYFKKVRVESLKKWQFMFQRVLFRDNVLKHARYNYETKSDLTFPKFGLIIFKTVLGPPIFSEYLKILREKN